MKRKVISTVIAACMVVGTMARKGYIKTFP